MTTTFHGVRYQVKDVARAIAFYTEQLGFTVRQQQLPAFASLALDGLTLFLSGPGASGSRPLPGGVAQEPGGANRIVLRVDDIGAALVALAGQRFLNSLESGPAGKQIQIADPDGNAIELFQPAEKEKAREDRPAP